MPKLRVIRVLEYTVECINAAQGKQILDHDFDKRFVKGIRGVQLGPKSIRELTLTAIYEDPDYGQAYRDNTDVQDQAKSSIREERSPDSAPPPGGDTGSSQE